MTGTPGTARFGINQDITPDETSANGVSHLTLPKNGNIWTETHFMYNPSQHSREMATTRGGNPGKVGDEIKHQSNYMCNHDGFAGGSNIVMNLDERKVLDNTIYSYHCEWADPGYDDTSDNGWSPRQTMGAFD